MQPQGSSAGTGRMPPPPAAGSPPGGPPPGKKRATNAVVAGVVGVIPGCGWLAAILAIAFGLSSQGVTRRSGLAPYGSAKAGVVLGVIGLVINIIFVILVFGTGR